jgi:hypothetical protein
MCFDKITIRAVAKQLVTVSFEWLCKDEAGVSDTWDYSGGASPAIIASPSYIAATVLPYKFYEAATLTFGGTVSKGDSHTNDLAVTSGTAISIGESFEIVLENNLDGPHYVGTDATPGKIVGQDWNATLTCDLDVSTLATTYYDYVRDGTDVAFQLTLKGALIEDTSYYTFQIILPSLTFEEGNYPDVSGSQGRRVQTLKGTAKENSDVDEAIGITIIDTQASY